MVMKSTWIFVISLAGLTISGSVLISLIPPLFDSGDKPDAWLLGALALVAVVFAGIARHWRPPISHPGDR